MLKKNYRLGRIQKVRMKFDFFSLAFDKKKSSSFFDLQNRWQDWFNCIDRRERLRKGSTSQCRKKWLLSANIPATIYFNWRADVPSFIHRHSAFFPRHLSRNVIVISLVLDFSEYENVIMSWLFFSLVCPSCSSSLRRYTQLLGLIPDNGLEVEAGEIVWKWKPRVFVASDPTMSTFICGIFVE